MYPCHRKMDKYAFSNPKSSSQEQIVVWCYGGGGKAHTIFFCVSCLGFYVVVSKERSLFQLMGMGKIGQMVIV